MGKYTIQSRKFTWDPWSTWTQHHFNTVTEAKDWMNQHGYKIGDYHRIVEAYTVTRYKAVKV